MFSATVAQQLVRFIDGRDFLLCFSSVCFFPLHSMHHTVIFSRVPTMASSETSPPFYRRLPNIKLGPVNWSTLLTRRRQRKQASAPTEEAKPEEPKPEETKPEETPTAEPVKADEPQAQEAKAWTPLEDAALLGLKAQNKSWKEIGEIILGRDKDELLNRYKELSPNTTADRGKDKDNSVNGAKDVTGGKGKTGKGAGEQKGQAKNDGPTDGAGEQAAKGYATPISHQVSYQSSWPRCYRRGCAGPSLRENLAPTSKASSRKRKMVGRNLYISTLMQRPPRSMDALSSTSTPMKNSLWTTYGYCPAIRYLLTYDSLNAFTICCKLSRRTSGCGWCLGSSI